MDKELKISLAMAKHQKKRKPDNKKINKKKINNFKIYYSITFAIQLGFFILIPIAGLMYGGFLIDNILGVSPLFFIIGIILGIVISAYGVYRSLAPLISKND